MEEKRGLGEFTLLYLCLTAIYILFLKREALIKIMKIMKTTTIFEAKSQEARRENEVLPFLANHWHHWTSRELKNKV